MTQNRICNSHLIGSLVSNQCRDVIIQIDLYDCPHPLGHSVLIRLWNTIAPKDLQLITSWFPLVAIFYMYASSKG